MTNPIARPIAASDIPSGIVVNNTTNVVRSGAAGASDLPLNISYNVSGTITTETSHNLIQINSDSVAASSESTLVNALKVNHNFGGGTAKGGFNAIYGIINHTAATGNSNGNYVAGLFVAQGGANDGGTGTGSLSKGELYGVNSNTRLGAGATNWKVINSAEFDIAVASGASVDHKRGVVIVQMTSDASAGVRDDAGLVIANQTGAIGWTYGICFGQDDGYQPIAASGTLIGAKPHSGDTGMGTVAYGVDLSLYTFSGAAFVAPLQTPASAAATGKAGSIVWDASFIYVCVATNTWKRVAVTTW